MMFNVLLTGGNGFIAVHILALLLARGYSVTTTVRAKSKTTHLRNRFAAAVNSSQLKFAIVEDMTVPGVFNDPLKNNSFDVVLHTSSPFVFNVNDITSDLLNPAIKGTTGILKSAQKYGPSVKRVVITSSFGSIYDPHKGDWPGHPYSENDWNPNDTVTGYPASKKLAEKAAWDFIENEKPRFDLVTICPPLIYGPALQEVKDMKSLNTSSTNVYSIFSDQTKELGRTKVWMWVGVRDVAEAHVVAFEKAGAGNQRFLLSEGTFNVGPISDFTWKHYPERAQAKGVPKSTPENGYPLEGNYFPNNNKSKDLLGLKYNHFEAMLKDQLEQFVALEKELGVY